MGSQAGIFGKSTATIDTAVSTTVTDVVDCVKRGPPCGLQMPATFVGTAITFQVAITPTGTYQAFHKDGSAYSITVANSLHIWLDPAVFYGIKYMKLVSGSAEANATAIEVVHRNT